MIAPHVQIVNLPQVFAGLAEMERGIDQLQPLWERFGREFYRQETAHFAAEPWVPLSPAYAQRKQEIFGNKPILRATDALFMSLTQQGASGNIHRVNRDGAEFGSSDFKAMLHFTGTPRMPARNPLAEPDIDSYTTIAGEYVEEVVRNAGFN